MDSSGKFWKWARLNLNFSPPLDLELQQDQDLGQSLINSRRLAVVPDIRIEEGSKFLLESVLRAVYEETTSQLKTLDLVWGDQKSIDAALIAGAVVKVENFVCTGGDLSQLQLQAIFSAVLESDGLTLKNLDLSYQADNIAGVSSDILGRAALRLESFRCAHLTEAQYEGILTRLAASRDHKLKELSIFTERKPLDLSHMNPEILSEALVKLESTDDLVRLDKVRLSSEQVTHLFTKIKNTKDLRLARAILEFIDISQVPPAVLAGAISRLKKVILPVGYMGPIVTPVQIEPLLTMLAGPQLRETKLKELWFGWTDLSSFSPELLVEAIRSLEKVNFPSTVLTTEQLNALLNMVVKGRKGSLKTIYLYCPETLSTVSPELLQAAMKVEELRIIIDLDDSYFD